MGFDTYLDVGDRTVVSWRKQTGSLPRLLFERDDLVVEVDAEGLSTAVKFESTAARVLECLTSNGLGWTASLAAYESVRSGGASEAMLKGMYSGQLWKSGLAEADLDAQVEAQLQPQRQSSAAEDLGAFGSLVADQWVHPTGSVLFFDQVAYDEPVEVSGSLIGQALTAAMNEGLAPLPIARVVETLGFLFRDAPLVAWPVLVSSLLAHLPPDTKVEYTLSEAIFEFDMSDEESAKSFVDRYWVETGDSISDYAQQLGFLFGALGHFQSRLGSPFWFGQVTNSLANLDELNADRTKSTNKQRGDALEELVDALIRTEAPELEVLVKNFKTEEEEIDLILTNNLPEPFWTAQHSPIILIECKNWKEPVGVEPLRVLESKLEDRQAVARIGIFVSMSGFTAPFLTRLKTIQTKGVGTVFAISGDELRFLISRRLRFTEWLRTEGALRAFGA